jgi:hypothetical protein
MSARCFLVFSRPLRAVFSLAVGKISTLRARLPSGACGSRGKKRRRFLAAVATIPSWRMRKRRMAFPPSRLRKARRASLRFRVEQSLARGHNCGQPATGMPPHFSGGLASNESVIFTLSVPDCSYLPARQRPYVEIRSATYRSPSDHKRGLAMPVFL